MSASEVAENMSTVVDISDLSERAIRPIVGMPHEQQLTVMQRATELNAGATPTSTHVRQAAAEISAPKPATCTRCGAERTLHTQLTSYDVGLIEEYPDRAVTLCSRCIPQLLAAQRAKETEPQAPPAADFDDACRRFAALGWALTKHGSWWKLAQSDGTHYATAAPDVQLRTLAVFEREAEKPATPDPNRFVADGARRRAIALLREIAPLMELITSTADQETLSMAIADLNECQEGAEARHWVAVGWALLDVVNESEASV